MQNPYVFGTFSGRVGDVADSLHVEAPFVKNFTFFIFWFFFTTQK